MGSCETEVCNPLVSTANNRFSSGQGYTYDENGSVTEDAAGQRFEYDAENHQTAFFNSSNGGSEPDATYYYDGEGRRVKKISSTETTLFVYDGGGQLVAEYSTELAETQQVSYLTQDHLGSPRVITNESGTVTSRKDFTAFGEENITADRTANRGYDPASTRKSYTGYEKDEESQLEFAQARYYNPTHGRFTSVDPMIASATIKNPQTFNRYSYVLNSPYKFVDPLGLISSSTGACGNWCRNSGPTGGYIGLYSDNGGVYAKLGWDSQKAASPKPAPKPAAEQNPEPSTSNPEPSVVSENCNIRMVYKGDAPLNQVTTTAEGDPTKIGPRSYRNENGEIIGFQFTFQVEAEVNGNPSDFEIEQQVFTLVDAQSTNGNTIYDNLPHYEPLDAPKLKSNVFKGTIGTRNLVNYADSPGLVPIRPAVPIGNAVFAMNGVTRMKRNGIIECSARWSIVQTVVNGNIGKQQFNDGRYITDPSEYR